jgi:hypothetical protein
MATKKVDIVGIDPRAIAANVLSSTYTQRLQSVSQFTKDINDIINKSRSDKFEWYEGVWNWVTNIAGNAVNAVADLWTAGEIITNQALDAYQQATLRGDNAFEAGGAFLGVYAGGAGKAITTSFEGGLAQVYQFVYANMVSPLLSERQREMMEGKFGGVTMPNPNPQDQTSVERLLGYFNEGGGLDRTRNAFDELTANLLTGDFDLSNVDFTGVMDERERLELTNVLNSFQTIGYYEELQRMMEGSRKRREYIDKLFVSQEARQAMATDQTYGFLMGVGGSIGRMLPSILLGKAFAAIGAGVGLKGAALTSFLKVGKLASEITFAGGIFAMSMEEAITNGASMTDAMTYAVGTMMTELALEQLGGVVLGDTTSVRKLTSLFQDMLQEGLEEGAAEVFAKPLSAFSTKDGQIADVFKNESSLGLLSRIATSALAGAVSAIGFKVPNLLTSNLVVGTKSKLGAAFIQNTQATAIQELLGETVVGNETEVAAEFSQRSNKVLKSLNKMEVPQARAIIENNPIYKEVFQEKVDDAGKVSFELTGTSQEIVGGRILARDEAGTLISEKTHAASKLSPLTRIKNTIVVGGNKLQVKVLTKEELANAKLGVSTEVAKEVDNLLETVDDVVIVRTPTIPFASGTQAKFSATFDPSTGLIYVNANNIAKGISRVASHEIYHKLKNLKAQGKLGKKAATTLGKLEKFLENDKQYEVIAKALSKNGVDLNWDSALEKLYRTQYKDVKNLETIIKEERVANFIEDVLDNETALKALAASKEGKTSQTILDVMRNMFGQDPNTEALINKLAQDMGISKKDLLKNKELNPVLKKLMQIQKAYTNVLQIAEVALKRQEDLSQAFGVNYRTNTLFSFNDEDKKTLNNLRGLVQQGQATQINEAIAENNEVSREFVKDLVLQGISSSINFGIGREDFASFSQDLNMYKKAIAEGQDLLSTEIIEMRDKLIAKLDMEFIEPTSELGQRGFFLRSGQFHFNKEDFSLVSKDLFVRGVKYIPENNTFEVSFDNTNQVLTEYNIYPSWVKPNGEVIKNPVYLNSSLSEQVLDYFLKYGTLPAQSFSINNAAAKQIKTKDYSNYIKDGSNRFFVTLMLNKDILEKRDAFLVKNDGYTFTRRLDMANPKTFKLTGGQVELEMSVKANVKVLEKTIQGIVRRIAMDKEVGSEYLLNQLSIITQNTLNPKINALQLKKQIEEANKAYSRNDLVDVYERALNALNSLLEQVDIQTIGRILNTFINPVTIAGGDMAYFGLGDGNPMGDTFKQQVAELNSIRQQNYNLFEALADFYDVTQYDIDSIAEGRSSVLAENVPIMLITNANVKDLQVAGKYKQIVDFASKNNIQVVVQQADQNYNGLIERDGKKSISVETLDEVFSLGERTATANFVPLEQLMKQETKKDNTKLLFSLKQSNYKTQEIKNRIEVGKTIENVYSVEEVFENDKTILNLFGTAEFKKMFPNIDNYTQQFIVKMLEEKTNVAEYGNVEENKARVLYIFSKLLKGSEKFNAYEGGIFGEVGKVYQNNFSYFNHLVNYLANDRVKENHAENHDFSTNDHFDDGTQVDFYLETVAQLLSEFLNFKKQTVLSLNGNREDVVVENIPNEYIPDFVKNTKEQGFFKSIGEILTTTEATNKFKADIQEVLDAEKLEGGKEAAGSLAFFTPFKDTLSKTVFAGNTLELYKENYRFGFSYGDYGIIYKANAFAIGVNERMGNLKVIQGSLAPYFTFTVFRQNEQGENYYQEKRIVSGDLYKKNGTIVENPVLLEFGTSFEGALSLIQSGKSLSQSLSMSFANSPSYSTTRQYSPTKLTKNGYFKVRFIAKDAYSLLSLDRGNFIGKGDVWTANRNKDVEFGDYFSLQSARINNSNLNVTSGTYDINNLTQASEEKMMKQNRDIAALSLATMASATDFMEGQDNFEESLYTYQNVVSAKKIETVFKELLSGGFNQTNINVRAADLKGLISQSQKGAANYLEAVDAFRKFVYTAIDLINLKHPSVSNVALVRALSAYVSDMYGVVKEEYSPIKSSLYNQFDTKENNDFVKELYKTLTSTYNAELFSLVNFLDGLSFNFDMINEIKVSKVLPEDVVVELEFGGDAQQDENFKKFIEEAKNKNVRVELIDTGKKEGRLSNERYQKLKEITSTFGSNNLVNNFVYGNRIAGKFADYQAESAMEILEREVKREQTRKYIAEDSGLIFSIKNENLTREEKRMRFAEKVKKVYGGKVDVVETKAEKAIEKKFENTIEQTQKVEATRTKVSKTNFNTSLGKIEKKASAYNALIRVVGTIRKLLELQRLNNFAKTNADLAAPIDNAVKQMNKVKAQLEALIGIKEKVSPFDPNVIADKVNLPFISEAEFAKIVEERAQMIDMVSKEQQPQGIIDRQTNFVDELVAITNAFITETLEKGTTEGETDIVATPTLVEPTDANQKPAFDLYKRLLKTLQWLSSYRKLSAFSTKPSLLKETISTIVRVENLVRELVATTNLNVKDVLNIFDASLTKAENFITKEEINEIEKLLFRMTSFDAEKKYTIYLEAKEMQDALFEDIIGRIAKTIEGVKSGSVVVMEKQLVEQTKEMEIAQKVKQQEVKIQREQLVQKPLSSREMKALWVRVYERRVQRVEKYLETLKADSDEYKETEAGVKSMRKKLSEMYMADYEKARDLVKDTVIKIFTEVNFKDDVPNALRELGNTGVLVKQAIDDKSVKTYEEFVQKYGKKLYKLSKDYGQKDAKEVGEVRTPYSGPAYVTVSEIKFSGSKATEAGIFIFEKASYMKTYENNKGETKGKVVQKPGVQVIVKETNESKYFRTAELAADFINRRVNQFVQNKNKNNKVIEQSSGEKAKEVAPSSTQEVMSIPKVEDVVAQPATPEPAVVTVEGVKPSKVWIPKETITVKYGNQEASITPEKAKALEAKGQWRFQSQEAWERFEATNMQGIEELRVIMEEEARIKALEAQQTLSTQPSTPSSPNSGGSGPKKVKVNNIFKTASIVANTAQDQYEQNEQRFSSVIEVILKRITNSSNKQNQALFSVYQKLEQIIRKFRTENNVYNHVSSAAAKAVIEEMDKIFRTIAPQGKITRIPTDQELANVAIAVNKAIYAALDYVDTNVRVKINENKENPFGFLFTRLTHWFLRDMKKVNNWDATQTQKFNTGEKGEEWRRLMNAIYNFNQPGYGMTELAAAVEGFHEATQVQPIVDGSLNENEPRTVDTIAKQWRVNTENLNIIRTNVRFNEQMNEVINPLLDPMTVADMIGLYDKKSWSNVMMEKIIRGQERIFEIDRVFEKTFSEEFLQKNNQEIIDLEKKSSKIVNLGGVEVRMSQIIYLRNMLFREIVRNKAIDLGLIKGEKTNHFRDGYKVNILAITEFKQKKMDNKVVAEIGNAQSLLLELDGLIKKDKFATTYNNKVYAFMNETYDYVNERFKELQGANLTNDGKNILKAMTKASKSQQDGMASVLPAGVKIEEIGNLYIPFLMDNSAYFKSQKLDFSQILDMGVFDGMVLELKDSSGRVSVESISNVVEGYKKEVANYYGLHRIMRDLNILFNYQLSDGGQTYFLNQNISKYAMDYFKTLLSDMAGYGSGSDLRSNLAQTLMRNLRQNFYAAALGFNVKVIFTQFATMLNLWNIYGEGDFGFLATMIKNLVAQQTGNNKVILEKMLAENNVMWDRSKGGSFELREATREGVKSRNVLKTLQDFSMKGIKFTDNMINKAFYLTLLEKTNPETGKKYTEAEASRTLTIGIIRSQSSGLAIAKSSVLRTQNDLAKIFLRFMGEALKSLTQFLSSSRHLELISKLKKNSQLAIAQVKQTVDNARVRLLAEQSSLSIAQTLENNQDFATQTEEFQDVVRKNIKEAERKVKVAERELQQRETAAKELERQINETIGKESKVKTQKGRHAATIFTQITYLSILGFMFELARTGGGAKDKPEDEELWAHLSKKLGANFLDQMVGMFPFVRDIYGAFRGYDLGGIAELTAVNSFIDAVSNIWTGITGGNINWNKTTYNAVTSLAAMFGIPLRNLERLFTTPLLYISEPTWYQYQTTIKGGQNRDNIELADAIRTNDTAMISVIVDRKLANRNMQVSSIVMNEMKRLAGKGFEVTMTGVPNDVEIDGKKVKLTQAEKEEFQEVYNRADAVAQRLMKSGQYRRLNDGQKARLLKAVFAYYYNLAKQEVLGVEVLSEKMTFGTLAEGYDYFLGRAEYYFENQRNDFNA